MQSTTSNTGGGSNNNNNYLHEDPSTPSSDPEANPKYIQQYLRSVIIHSLDTLNYKNAEFASERLIAIIEADQQQQQQLPDLQQESEEMLDSIYLYCLVLFKQDRFKTCYYKLNNLKKFDYHLGCSFLYGKCCLKLGKFKEGLFHLIKTKKFMKLMVQNNIITITIIVIIIINNRAIIAI